MSLGKMDNPNAVSNMLKFLGQEQQDLNSRYAKEVMQLHHLVKSSLVAAIGERAKYFDVVMEPGAFGVEIAVVAKDSVGSFIYRGTAAHDIISTYQPMPMPDGGFARSARHPGTKPMKEQIDEAIMSAIRMSGMM